MTIKYSEIFSKCRDLSSFEGKRITSGSGESMYDIVHIVEQDEDLIQAYTDEALMALQGTARYAIENVLPDGDDIEITPCQANALNFNGNLENILKECISSYVMSLWLKDKDEARATAYEGIFTNMLAQFTRLAYRKHAPRLTDYDD